MKRTFKISIGSRWIIPVKQEHINESDPCNKDKCMLTRALKAFLAENFGQVNYRVKSTNHGTVFDIHGRRLTAVFDTGTGNTIYGYDQTFKKTRSKARAIAGVKPFSARIMIESNSAVPKFAPMTAEAKARLRKHGRNQSDDRKPRNHRRELSL